MNRRIVRHIALYALATAVLIVALRILDYSYLVRAMSFNVYGFIIGAGFLVLGIGFGYLYFNRRVERRNALAVPTVHATPGELIDPLTPREEEVLTLIAAGKTNQQIADEMFVSISTVKTHINNLYGKLGVQRRTQALVRARELGMLSWQHDSAA